MFRGLREKLFAVSCEAKSKPIEDITEVVDESGRRLKDNVLDDILHELELSLLEADVAMPVAEELTRKVREALAGKRIDKTFDLYEAVKLALRAAVKDVLSEKTLSITERMKAKPRPNLVDEQSPKGIEVFQLTSEPDVPASHLYMEAQIFTPGLQAIQPWSGREANGIPQRLPETLAGRLRIDTGAFAHHRRHHRSESHFR